MSNDIGWAVEQMLDDKRVARGGWGSAAMYLALQVPDNYSKMDLPYFYIRNVTGELVPWTPAHADLLATEWSIAT
jgi:hypothetical protein